MCLVWGANPTSEATTSLSCCDLLPLELSVGQTPRLCNLPILSLFLSLLAFPNFVRLSGEKVDKRRRGPPSWAGWSVPVVGSSVSRAGRSAPVVGSSVNSSSPKANVCVCMYVCIYISEV